MLLAGERFSPLTDGLVLAKLVMLAVSRKNAELIKQLIGFSAQMCLFVVLQTEKAGRVAVISYAGAGVK